MKGESKQGRGNTLLVIVLAVLLVAAAALVFVFAFRKLKTADNTYTPVEQTNQQETVIEDPPTTETKEKTAQLESLDNTLMEQQNTTKTTEDVFKNRIEYLKVQDMIEREFVVNEQDCYLLKSEYSFAAEENCISAEEAVQTAYNALKENFPDRNWDMSFCAQIFSSDGVPFLYDEEEKLDTVWFIYDPVYGTRGSMVAVNPYTGEMVSVYAPYDNSVYITGGEFNSTLCLTMRDFFELSDDSSWVTWGMMRIREHGLDNGETVIRFDEEKGVTRTPSGGVFVTYYIGSGDEAKKIDISMDLLTHELTGYAMLENMK